MSHLMIPMFVVFVLLVAGLGVSIFRGIRGQVQDSREFRKKLDRQRNIGNRIFNALSGVVIYRQISISKHDGSDRGRSFMILIKLLGPEKTIATIFVNCIHDEDSVIQEDIRFGLGYTWKYEDGTMQIFGASEEGIQQFLISAGNYIAKQCVSQTTKRP